MKKFKGFTLIELIVVIAIIGVLCAILVPSMMGWVTKSRVNSANSNAKSIYNSAASVLTSFETQGLDLTGADGNIPDAETQLTSPETVAETDVTFEAEVSRMEDTSSSSAKWAVQLDKGYVESAVYSSNGNSYWGAFPCAVPEKIKVTSDDGLDLLTIAATKDATAVKTAWDSFK